MPQGGENHLYVSQTVGVGIGAISSDHMRTQVDNLLKPLLPTLTVVITISRWVVIKERGLHWRRLVLRIGFHASEILYGATLDIIQCPV